MTRRPHDAYYTPGHAVDALKKHWDGWKRADYLIEPCVGGGDILHAFDEVENWVTADIDRTVGADLVRDMTRQESWDSLLPCHWFEDTGPQLLSNGVVITNPPFSSAFEIISLAVQNTKAVAALLRLFFLEPTQKRGPWLEKNPPDLVIVLPRISFTGDGKTDSVTCAWMVWDKNATKRGVVVEPRG